jgi:hypothetical protein
MDPDSESGTRIQGQENELKSTHFCTGTDTFFLNSKNQYKSQKYL